MIANPDTFEVVLYPDDIQQVNAYFDIVWSNWILTSVKEYKCGVKLDPLEGGEDGTLSLKRDAVTKLQGFVSMAAGVHFENYKHVSQQHEHVCDHNDMTKSSTLGYLDDLEILLAEEASAWTTAMEFRQSLGDCLTDARVETQ